MASAVIVIVLCSVILSLTSAKLGIGLIRDGFTLEDAELILSNPRTVDKYVKCILGEGPCTADGRQIRAGFPLAIQTACAECSETEKKIVKLAARYIILSEPKAYKDVLQKFDPDHKYIEAFLEFISKD